MARILVIDDEEGLRMIVREILESAGHEVLLAGDGQQGLELQRTERADLVITDIFMPQKEGIETIIELRQEFPGIKIIAMSGGGALRTLDYLPAAQEFGALRTLSKPFEAAVLLATVDELLGG